MSKVLFTNAYFYRFDSKQWEDQRPYPPYGTMYAASLMRSKGYEVSLFDTNLVHAAAEIAPHLDEELDFLVIYDDGFNYLSKMCLTVMRDAALEMIKMARAKVKHILVCSSDSTDHPKIYLEAGADFVIQGEGELTLAELSDLLQNNERETAKSILGVAYLEGDKLMKNARRPVLKQLDDLPDPAWDLVDLSGYREIWMNGRGFFSLNIATTRGCPYKCNWCAKPIYGNRYNSRSPKRVAQEVAMLIQEKGAEYFWVCDDIFGLKPGWVQSFNQEIKALGVRPRYKIQSRVDLLLKEDTIDALVESGLDEVWVGAESGSQHILDAMDKGTQVEQIYEATRLLKAKGVRVGFFLQFGYIGETKEDIDKTIQMVKDLVPDDIGISVSYPLPGTKFYEKVKVQLAEKQNWTDSDDLAMMYRGTYSPAYYRRLHRYVHKVFRLQQAWSNFWAVLRRPASLNGSTVRSIAAAGYYLPAMLIDRLRLSRLATANA